MVRSLISLLILLLTHLYVLCQCWMCLCFRFKVLGELPLLHVKISDQKIQNVLELVDSIPLPNMGSSPSTPTEKVQLVQSGLKYLKHLGSKSVTVTFHTSDG